MRRRLLLAGSLLGAFVVALSQGAGPPSSSPPAGEPTRAAPPTTAPAPPPEMRRNPFEFGDGDATMVREREERALASVAALHPSAATPAAAASPVRLVGFVAQAGRLRAALVLENETFLLGPGEEAGGYTLLSADESAGVRLRTPGGGELALAVPE